MKTKTVIILASSRKNGDTAKLTDKLMRIGYFDRIDLNDYNISYYDYEHKNIDDDFLKLIRQLIDKYETFLFATPVYMYAMSGILKVFFDRITDMIDLEKELGRKLREKKMAIITSSVGDNLGDNFWLPFIANANYLGMRYVGNLHTVPNQFNNSQLKEFISRI